MSVHDHGTAIGSWIADIGWLMRPLTWGVLGLEIVFPLLFLIVPRPRLRLAIVCAFILFHLAIQTTMSVGLFAAIGVAAWLALIPGAAWTAARHAGGPDAGRLSPLASAACILLLAAATTGLVHGLTALREWRLPAAVRVPLNLCGLVQEWGMFGVVNPTEQWIYAPAVLADGRRIDLLRRGKPLEEIPPRGGFTTLPHHRWHKLAWLLPRPAFRPLAAHLAAALARDWNVQHAADARVEFLEIRFVVQGIAATAGVRHEQLLASWPDRGTDGAGSLDRFLDESGGDATPR